MASWADAAAKLTEAQRWEVLCLYRHNRRRRRPVDALALLGSVFAAQCTTAAVAADWPAVTVSAYRYAYVQVLLRRVAFRESPGAARLATLW